MKPIQVWCAAIALLCLVLSIAQPAEGKGYTGYRSSIYGGYGAYGAGYGGGYRPYRYGAYSPYTRYYVWPVIWTHGTHQRGYSDPEFEAQLEDVMCKRNLTVASNSTTTSAFFSFDSRRYCYHQNSAEPGSPLNQPMTGLFIDVFRWNISTAVGQPLTITFEFFPDQTNMVTPDFTYTTIIRNVTWPGNPGTLITPTGDLFTYGSNVQNPLLSTTAMANLMTAGVQSADQQSYATFQLSDDFVEDSTGHIFYRPDSLATTLNILPPVGDVQVSLGIDVLTNKSKDSYFTAATVGTVYNPPQMDRVSIGNMADETDRQRGYISWRRTSQLWRPCLGSTYDNYCIKTGCEANATSTCPLSPDKLGDQGFSFNLGWQSSRPASGSNPPFEVNNIRMHIGYMDVTTLSDSAVLARPAVALLAVILAAMVLLL